MNTPVGTLSTVRTSEFMKYVLMPSLQASVKFAELDRLRPGEGAVLREVGRRSSPP